MSDRLIKLRALMKEKGFDALFATSPESHIYLSGYANPDGCLLVLRDGGAFAFEDFRYIEAAKREIDCEEFTVVMPDGPRKSWLGEAFNVSGAKVVAYEDATLTARGLENLKKEFPAIDFVPAGDILYELRVFKDEGEVECIVKAQRIAEKSFMELLPLINYDCTETYVAAQLEFLMRKNGSEGASFDTIAVSGSNSSSPHGVPRNVKLERGFLTLDFGATIGGYHSDMTRTVVIGKADEKMKHLYNTVLDAQMAVLEVISEGESCFKMDKIARDIIYGRGYEGAFGHALGHGVGLEVHEAPALSPRSGDRKLICGDIVTVEPGIYLEGKYGCRIEDMVYITNGGAKNLTDCTKELIEI
ncbi:MAG: aminopeptidase P family protein [Clostridia bacterium]|nr:aminopeptidase P family protein [Clostridia bacterium]